MRYAALMLRSIFYIFVLFMVLSRTAQACGPRVEIRFYEDSGGDVFEITNTSQEAWSVASLVLTLTGSAGRLVFDTADGGLGASMHQPFYASGGEVGFIGASPVDDGSEVLALKFSDFAPGKTFTFVVDVDDRLPSDWEGGYDQAHVSNAEIVGASGSASMVRNSGDQAQANGAFGAEGEAILGGGGLCA